jgi:hypothetical protein
MINRSGSSHRSLGQSSPLTAVPGLHMNSSQLLPRELWPRVTQLRFADYRTPSSTESTRRVTTSHHEQPSGSLRPDTIFGAIASVILDYTAVAAVIGLFALVRWSGITFGRTLDLLLVVVVVVVVALSIVAWFAGSRFDLRLTRAMLKHADSGPMKTMAGDARPIDTDD